MNRYAVFHAADSTYCFPASLHELTLRLRAARDDLAAAEVIYESKYVFGTSQRRAPLRKIGSSELFDYYSVTLRLRDTRVAYVFYLDDGESRFYFSEDGVTDSYDFSLGYYNFFQYPYINRCDVPQRVEWMEHAVFYQIFVDRFRRGARDKDTSYINLNWGGIPHPGSFAGGDLDGVTERLDHIQALGCSAIYLTPVFQSPTNHKYDVVDYYRVDPHFGGDEALRRLVRAAHGRGMRVVLDGVFNHCSMYLRQFQDVVKKGRDSAYYSWFLIDGDFPDPARGNYEMFAACEYMPKWNTSCREAQDYLIGVGRHYIREYGIDGWRLDVCDEVSHVFWRRFRQAIKEEDPQAVLIGENWHDASASLRGDQYDSIMNYAFTKACLDFFAAGRLDARHMAWRLNEILMRNTDTADRMMLNLLDSHDTNRFFTEVGGDREAFHAALCLLYLFPGAPCIFYGTEFYTPGGYDPDCRRCMDWARKDTAAPLLAKLAALPREGEIAIGEEHGVLVVERGDCALYINRTQTAALVRGRQIRENSHLLLKGGEPI